MRRIKIVRPNPRIDSDVRVFIDGVDISDCVTFASVEMDVVGGDSVRFEGIGA